MKNQAQEQRITKSIIEHSFARAVPVRPNVKIGKWVSSDLLIGSNVHFSSLDNTKAPKTAIETALLLSFAPHNSNNDAGYERVFDIKQAAEYVHGKNGKTKLPLNFGGGRLANPVPMIINTMLTGQDAFNISVYEKISPSKFRLNDPESFYGKNTPHKQLFQTYVSDEILSRFSNEATYYSKAAAFGVMLLMSKMCGDNIRYTHNLTQEILGLNRNDVKKLSKRYGVRIAPINRELMAIERATIDAPDTDGLRKGKAQKIYQEYKNRFGGIEQTIAVGYSLVADKNTLQQAIELFMNDFDNRFKVNYDVLATVVNRFNNKIHKYTKRSFKRDLKLIGKLTKLPVSDYKGFKSPAKVAENCWEKLTKIRTTLYHESYGHISESKKFSLQRYIHATNKRRGSTRLESVRQSIKFYKKEYFGKDWYNKSTVALFFKHYDIRYVTERGKFLFEENLCFKRGFSFL